MVTMGSQASGETGLNICTKGFSAALAVGDRPDRMPLAVQQAVQQDFPVRLRLQRDVQALILEKTLFLGDGERGHVGQLDETQRQLVFLDPGGFGKGGRGKGGRGKGITGAW